MYVYMTKQLKLARLYYYNTPFFKHLPKVSFKKLTMFLLINASNPPPEIGGDFFAATQAVLVCSITRSSPSEGWISLRIRSVVHLMCLNLRDRKNRGRSLVGTLETHPGGGSFNLEFSGFPQWFLENIPRIIGRRSHSKLP